MTWTTLGHELKTINVRNISRLWLTKMNLCCELKALDAMNIFGLRLTRTTLGYVLRAPDDMNNDFVPNWCMSC